MKVLTASVRKVLDSLAKPTIEVEINGHRSSVPTGTSKSQYEVVQLPVKTMLARFRSMKAKTKKKNFYTFQDILDFESSLEPRHYGGNLILALSYSLLKSLSTTKGKEVYQFLGKKSVPRPVLKVIEGGRHANGPSIQEILVIPKSRDFERGVWEASELFFRLADLLEKKDKGFMNSRGMEGGWVTSLGDLQALDLVRQGIDSGGFHLDMGVDMAATSFYSDRMREYKIMERSFSREEMVDFVRQTIVDNKLVYVEDPLEEDDYEGFQELKERTRTMIVGDDIFSTNVKRLRPVANGAIVKPNQIGSLGGTIRFLNGLGKIRMTPIISHRSRETEDVILAHLAVGLGFPFIKIGLTSGERTAKVNELLRILK
jgi:enolase